MAPSDQGTVAQLRTLLEDGTLAGHWTLDPAASTVRLDSKSMWGLVKVKGTFGQVSGEGTVTADGTATGVITVVAASVDTGNGKRDTHLRSADFFDTANHPGITFRATGVSLADGGLTVSGTLTVRDRTQPVTVTAAVSAHGADQVVLDAAVPVNRADFGLTWSQLGMASLHNTITVHAVFTRN
jgi:polyisoprenoid-binding protein YceI